MHSPDLRQKFIELRAAAHSIPKISSFLSVAQSTLRLWEKDDALEIARLRRIYWEDAEDRVGITLENRLRRMAEWIQGAEDELEKRHFDLMNNRDLMRFLRESRREYFRLRAMLFSAENTLGRTHHTGAKATALEDKASRRPTSNSNTADFQSNPSDLNPLPINTPLQRCEPTQPSESLTASAVSPATLQPISNATDKIGELADFPPTQSRPTNDLQQPESATSHFDTVERSTFGGASPLINTPLQQVEPTKPTAAPTASAGNNVAAGVSPASEPGVSPGDANPAPKKHKPYWLNGHYYQNPEYPEYIARAISSALSLRGKGSS